MFIIVGMMFTLIGCPSADNSGSSETSNTTTTIPYGEARVIETKTYEDIVENTEIMKNPAQCLSLQCSI